MARVLTQKNLCCVLRLGPWLWPVVALACWTISSFLQDMLLAFVNRLFVQNWWQSMKHCDGHLRGVYESGCGVTVWEWFKGFEDCLQEESSNLTKRIQICGEPLPQFCMRGWLRCRLSKWFHIAAFAPLPTVKRNGHIGTTNSLIRPLLRWILGDQTSFG